MSFFNVTGNPTIITPQQSGTSYYFVTFSNPGTGTITFTSPVSDVSYLVVGGGGGGSAGYQEVIIPNILDGAGGGGAGGDLLNGTFSPTISQLINISIGSGGSGGDVYSGRAGGSGNLSIITYNSNTITAFGGNGAASDGIGGVSSYGSGGNGAVIGNQDRPPTNASGYPSGFSPYTLNGYNVGSWGGGGAAGYLINSPIPNSNPQGQGGTGGVVGNSNGNPGINGGGGGGGCGQLPLGNGGNGGNGVVILSFKQDTKYKIPGGQDLSDIFYPLSLGGVTGSTGTGYNYNTGSGFQDLTNLFAQYVTGTPTAPQTYYTTNYYGGKDLNQVFQNINYPPYYRITSSSNLKLTQYNNNGYIGLVFEVDNSASNATATILFNINITNATIIAIGGGGSGGNDGGGGGGGGITSITGYNINQNQSYNLTVGNGGSSPPNNLNSNGNAGASSIFDTSYTSNGGQGGIAAYNTSNLNPNGGNGGSINTVNGGGGGGGAGGFGYDGSGGLGGTGGTNSNSLNLGNNGDNYLNNTTPSYGGSSYYYNTINIPFLQPSTSIIVGGGAGGGYENNKGGLNGFGNLQNKGGQSNSNIDINGESALSSILTGYGNGGGGSSYNTTTGQFGIGGKGGDGVVIIYW
jgi:hypothetical protein